MDGQTIQTLQFFEHWAVILPEQSIGHMQSIVWVDADQVGVEGGVMYFRQGDPVQNYRLAEPLIRVLNGSGAN